MILKLDTCGIAAVDTIFTYYYDIPTKEEDLAKDFFPAMVKEKRGISLLDMKRFAKTMGFEAYGYKTNYSGLFEVIKKNPLPIIVHMKQKTEDKEIAHFSIIAGIVDDYIVLNDTASGNIILGKEDFLSKWTGYLLIIIPPKEAKAIYEKVYERLKEQQEEVIKHVQKIYFYRDIKYSPSF
ncbi:MAG: cysteine peptidase family C39 domain-containing protein [bacterium]